jgi:hypothetical protein
MSPTTRTNFLGIPVEGNINPGEKRATQRPLPELEPLLRAVLDDDGIHDFGWRQYTPYFNDGDACVFSAGQPWFRTTADLADSDGDEAPDDPYTFDLHGHPTLGDEHWDGHRWAAVERDEATRARAERARALSQAIESGEFDDVLLEEFGDHCQIWIRRSGITVDEYSHD